eukprot:jgi/Mesvir1/28169/Mv04729-RA.1
MSYELDEEDGGEEAGERAYASSEGESPLLKKRAKSSQGAQNKRQKPSHAARALDMGNVTGPTRQASWPAKPPAHWLRPLEARVTSLEKKMAAAEGKVTKLENEVGIDASARPAGRQRRGGATPLTLVARVTKVETQFAALEPAAGEPPTKARGHAKDSADPAITKLQLR